MTGLAGNAQGADRSSSSASTTDFPNKPVRFISPFSPGGGTDTVARMLAARMGEQLGRVFVVDNRGGAEGVLGTELGAKAPPDGYTLLVANLGTFSMTPNLRKVSYDPLRDFAPITQTIASATVLTVSPTLAVHTLKDFVELAKSKAGRLNYAAGSNATALPMDMLRQIAGFNITAVPYKGSAPSVLAVVSSEVSALFGGAIITVPHVKGERLRALALAGDRRTQALPDIPTIAESGYPGYEANSWNGIVAPAGTPRAIIEKLNLAIVKVLRTAEVKNYMVNDGADSAPSAPDDFAAFLRADHAKWARVIRMAGLRGSQ